MARTKRWRDPSFCLELFILANYAFLGPDIYLAHSTNLFRHWAEYIPFLFSLCVPVVLLIGMVAWSKDKSVRLWQALGHLVGCMSVTIGIAGLILHLESHFFKELTLDSLVYTAPFAAPLAYTGLGLLLIMNRMVKPETTEWAMWALLLSFGGFMGNFIFSLADHAQNGFFHATEWIPVVSSAFAMGFLLAPFCVAVNRSYLLLCGGVMIIQAAVGILGFYYHARANLHGPSPHIVDNCVYGAPSMAPLLFPNLALLTLIGLWALRERTALDT
jgi:hypothetical protein